MALLLREAFPEKILQNFMNRIVSLSFPCQPRQNFYKCRGGFRPLIFQKPVPVRVQRRYKRILSKPLTAHMPTIDGDDGASRV